MLDIWITDFWLLLKGAVIGFAVAAPVGPIGMLCIRTTLERGRIAGFAAGLGAAVADAVYGAIGVLGVTAISGIIEAQRFWLELGGGVFVIAFGIHLGLTRPNYQNSDEIPVSLFADFLKTLLLTLANPSTILTFMAIFAGVPAAAGAAQLQAVPVIVLGVLLGSAAWWLTLSQGVGFIRHRISEQALKWMNWVAGILLVGFGLYTLGHLVLHWRD
jgi:threonine/homoserine/homoserine lactone efflux protein